MPTTGSPETPAPRRGLPTERRRFSLRLGKDRVRAVLALGVVFGLGSVGTLAAWTDQSTATSGAFSTGTIDIKLGNPAIDNDPPAFTTTFAMTNMAPGSVKEATLKVSNSGTVPFTYTMSSTATNSGGGADQLGAAMKLEVFPGSCGGTAVNTPTTLNGTAIAARPLAVAATEDLCFRATLPTTSASALQGKTTTATFTFNATNS